MAARTLRAINHDICTSIHSPSRQTLLTLQTAMETSAATGKRWWHLTSCRGGLDGCVKVKKCIASPHSCLTLPIHGWGVADRCPEADWPSGVSPAVAGHIGGKPEHPILKTETRRAESARGPSISPASNQFSSLREVVVCVPHVSE